MKKKILMIDDDQSIIESTKSYLEKKGYEVLSAFDGQAGLDLAKGKSPDVIILDVLLPKMDGYKVCGLLKADIRYQKIPIIMLSGRVEEADQQISQEIGANVYLNKPIKPDDLLNTIEVMLTGKKN